MLRDKVKDYKAPEALQKVGLYNFFRVIDSEQDAVVKMNGKDVIMLGSNSYLGLTNHPKLKAAAKKAIDKYGTGTAGSRLLNGTLDLHVALEQRIAQFMNKEAALVFSSGYQVNLGVLSSLMGRTDHIILDEYDHACIYDGARLAFAKVRKFNHNDMEDLEATLQKLPDTGNKLIVVDGVFSMEGDIAKLPQIVALAKKYGASIMVDDAHGLGVLGNGGRGTADYFGLNDEVELIMGTFSKSFATVGGFIAGSAEMISYLKHLSRSLIFSASISPANAASAFAAIDLVDEEPERIDKVWENTRYAKKKLIDAGFNTGHSETPIIPVFIGDETKTYRLTSKLLEQGVFVNQVVSPAVPKGQELLRLSLMATHTKAHIDQGIDKLIALAKQLEII